MSTWEATQAWASCGIPWQQPSYTAGPCELQQQQRRQQQSNGSSSRVCLRTLELATYQETALPPCSHTVHTAAYGCHSSWSMGVHVMHRNSFNSNSRCRLSITALCLAV